MENMPTGTSNAGSRIQRLNIADRAEILPLLAVELRIGCGTLLIETGQTLLLAREPLTRMATGQHLGARHLGHFLTLLLGTDVLQRPNATATVDLLHDIATVSTFPHQRKGLELLAALPDVVGDGLAGLALLGFAVHAVVPVLGVVLLHEWRQGAVACVLYNLLLALDELELGLAFRARHDVALFADDLVLQVAETLLADELCDGPWVDGYVAAFEEALERPVLVDELLGDVLDHAGLAEQVPALLNIEQALDIKVRVEFLLAF